MSRPPLQPQNKHVSSYLFKDSTSDAVNLDSPGKYDISDEEESTSASKSRFKNALNTGKDYITTHFARHVTRLTSTSACLIRRTTTTDHLPRQTRSNVLKLSIGA
jgi:hypothetical protein